MRIERQEAFLSLPSLKVLLKDSILGTFIIITTLQLASKMLTCQSFYACAQLNPWIVLMSVFPYILNAKTWKVSPVLI